MRRLLLAFAAVVVILGPGSLTLQAAGQTVGNGVIDGSIVEKTAGTTLQSGGQAYLYELTDGQQPSQKAQLNIDSSGRFRFTSVATDPSNIYEVGVQYQGAPYFSDKITFTPGQTTRQISLDVYEPTPDDKVLSLATTSLLVDPDDKTHELAILELDTFINNSNRSFIPSTTPRNGGPPNLLRFSLPPNATALTPGQGMGAEDIIQIGTGFGAVVPLLPGRQDIGFTYRDAYQTSSLAFSKNVIYPTKSFRILMPAGTGQVDSPQLTRQPDQTIGGKSYELLMATDLQPGAKVDLRFSSLPGISPLAILSQPDSLRWLAVALGVAVLGLLAWYLRDRRRAALAAAGKPGAGEPADGRDLEVQRRDLLIALARLDDRYDEGTISAEDYRVQRDVHKAELRDLMQQLEALGQG